MAPYSGGPGSPGRRTWTSSVWPTSWTWGTASRGQLSIPAGPLLSGLQGPKRPDQRKDPNMVYCSYDIEYVWYRVYIYIYVHSMSNTAFSI